jgi:hypothetical protein
MPNGTVLFSSEGRRRTRSDDEGLELTGLNEAKREALQGARELLAEAIKSGSSVVPEAFVIADEAGQTVHVLPLAEILPKPLKVK